MILRGFRRRKKKIIHKNDFVPNTIRCKQGCIYYRLFGGTGGIRACHYCFDTGELRGSVPGEDCDKFCNDRKKLLKNYLNKRINWTSGVYSLVSSAHIKEVLK